MFGQDRAIEMFGQVDKILAQNLKSLLQSAYEDTIGASLPDGLISTFPSLL